MVKGIIFDLDDTMVNSDPLHTEAWQRLLQEYNHSVSDIPKSMRANHIGMRVSDIVREVATFLHLKADTETIYKKRIDIFLNLAREYLEVMPGLLPTLELLRRHRYPLAIASSGAKAYINLVLDKFDIRDYFDVVTSGDDVTKGKPDPETYLITAQRLRLDPTACLVLEDAKKGIQSAKVAGCKCIAIKNPYTPPQNLSQADLILSSLNELTLQIIQKL